MYRQQVNVLFVCRPPTHINATTPTTADATSMCSPALPSTGLASVSTAPGVPPNSTSPS